LHYYDPNKTSTRVIGKTFVLACNGIETPKIQKILLLSKNDKNPNGVASSSDQVGRDMMDTPKMEVLVRFKEPVWSGLGPVQTGAIMSTSQGDCWPYQHCRSHGKGPPQQAMWKMNVHSLPELGRVADRLKLVSEKPQTSQTGQPPFLAHPSTTAPVRTALTCDGLLAPGL
jgi:hypothetical protein